MTLGTGKRKENEQLVMVPVGSIRPNPAQPRQVFREEQVRSLAESIRRYGILQPLTVRSVEGGYELIAGERRLRAAQLAGLARVPCAVWHADGEESAVLAVIENLQREDLNLFEAAGAMARLMAHYGLTQEEVAEKLSLSQSCVANKLRLLKLEEEIRAGILEGGLTERHARALLRLPMGQPRREALAAIRRHGYNVAQTEEYIERLLAARTNLPQPRRRIRGAMGSLRLFTNSLEHAMALAGRAGVTLVKEETETETEYIYTIRVAKAASSR